MWKGFREFILQGDVIGLAVAFVIAAAFTAMVNVFVSSVITPVLAAAGGAHAVSLGVNIRPDNPATRIDFGAMINAVIVFLITALVVYLIFVVPKRKYDDWKAARGEAPEEEVEENTQLLREIRDSLANRNS